ncbi:MAG: LytTR family DNA-binding domain-containing protein [Lachnospiraceae bacterium]|nr:LytTR family DNA-binding domain-containing protein [Lachnospiraceae bacterium]
MKIAICDDESRGREGIKDILKEAFPEIEIREFSSGQKLEEAAETEYLPDIILMDIAVNGADGMDGMETARKLRKLSPETILIFVTSVREQVFQAFDVGAFHYLLKPVEKEKLISVVARAIAEVEKTNAKPKYMLVKVPGGYRRLNMADILYAESDGRKVILHLKQENLEFYEKMEELEQRLGEGFYRCHRGYLVSLSEIMEYDKANIRMSNGETVYLAKRKYSEFVQAYGKYLRE